MKKYLFASLLIWAFTACEKEKTNVDNTDAVSTSITSGSSGLENTNSQTVPGGIGSDCTISGVYAGNIVGTSPANNGIVVPLAYDFWVNNFCRGGNFVNSWISFGGYRVKCDSLIWTAVNSDGAYVIHKTKFSNNRNTISGTFQDLNNPMGYGNLTLNKQ